MNRRQFGALLASGGLLAGCLDRGDENGQSSEDSSGSDDWIQEAQDEPAYDRTVTLRNRTSKPVEVDVEVVHEGDAGIVHSDRHAVDGKSETNVYDFRDAPTDGVEQYRIEGQLPGGETTSFTYSTNACLASPSLIVEADGALESTWAEC